jgi:SAM-dependent methyltransferase
MRCVDGLQPIVEIGSGPGFFKEYFPRLISTDLIPSPWIDVACDACSLPFRSGTVGALVCVDALHHLPKPLEFMSEAGRVLQPGGRLAMIEPWITPLSFLLYRYFHHEDCRLGVDLACPFNVDDSGKKAFDGNAAIPFKLVKYFKTGVQPLRLIQAEAFLGLPYLLTLGFKCARPISQKLVDFAKVCERLIILRRIARFSATRVLIVWENNPYDSIT